MAAPTPPLLPPTCLGKPCRIPEATPNPEAKTRSSSSSSSVACDAMTWARRALAALAARFWVRLIPDKLEAEAERLCPGEKPGEEDPDPLDPPLPCREYAGLPARIRSITATLQRRREFPTARVEVGLDWRKGRNHGRRRSKKRGRYEAAELRRVLNAESG